MAKNAEIVPAYREYSDSRIYTQTLIMRKWGSLRVLTTGIFTFTAVQYYTQDGSATELRG
jgi:hypothetical protein